jgi:apolipoprotein N-acyltransferase
MATAGVARTLLAAAAGAATVFGFAPFNLPGVAIVGFAALMTLWLDASPRDAARSGFAFGLGLFGAGASWVYVAINTFGGMPMPLAAIGTAIWTAYLALFPALTGWLATRFTAAASLPRVLAAAAIWTLAEMFRGTGYTGFPWLVLGYAQLPPDGVASPLAGYATLGGVWLVTLAATLAGGALALAVHAFATPARRRGLALLLGSAAIAAGGSIAAGIEWTAPHGAPVAVSLVQGNVPQETKFDPNLRDETFRIYVDLVSESRGRLVVLPESAFPVFADEVPDHVLVHMLRTATARDGDVLAGVFTAEPPLPGRAEPRYYNSVVSLGSGDVQLYRKRHLVPFGETIPLEFLAGWFIRSVLAIPLAEQTPGDWAQPPMAAAGQRVAVNICYEDAFGGELRSQAANATLLVNVTNDAWYGRSLAAVQHNQIAAMRALETGRPLLRATNTGITSAIDHRGHEIARLPWFTRGILELAIAGRQGVTPYVRWGDAVAIALAALLLAVAALASARAGRSHGRLAPGAAR